MVDVGQSADQVECARGSSLARNAAKNGTACGQYPSNTSL
jgi:hypothetical protein